MFLQPARPSIEDLICAIIDRLGWICVRIIRGRRRTIFYSLVHVQEHYLRHEAANRACFLRRSVGGLGLQKTSQGLTFLYGRSERVDCRGLAARLAPTACEVTESSLGDITGEPRRRCHGAWKCVQWHLRQADAALPILNLVPHRMRSGPFLPRKHVQKQGFKIPDFDVGKSSRTQRHLLVGSK